ncbi:MAG: hypothetical protein U9Q67_02780, partial [Patescibacteria group bacterium]|nr:hypothetical protein [Patescibacteria group bacterium]
MKKLLRQVGILISKTHYVILLLPLNLALLLRNCLFPGIFSHGDLGHPLFLDNYIKLSQYMFIDAGALSNFENVDRAIFLMPLSYLFKILQISETKYLIAFIFFAILFLSQVSFAHLLKRVFKVKNNIILFVCGILYSMSPWVVEQYQAY